MWPQVQFPSQSATVNITYKLSANFNTKSFGRVIYKLWQYIYIQLLKFAKLGLGKPTWQTGLFQAELGETAYLAAAKGCLPIRPQELPGLQHLHWCCRVPSSGPSLYLFLTQESKLYPHCVYKLCSQVQLLLPGGQWVSLRARVPAPFFIASLLSLCGSWRWDCSLYKTQKLSNQCYLNLQRGWLPRRPPRTSRGRVRGSRTWATAVYTADFPLLYITCWPIKRIRFFAGTACLQVDHQHQCGEMPCLTILPRT